MMVYRRIISHHTMPGLHIPPDTWPAARFIGRDAKTGRHSPDTLQYPRFFSVLPESPCISLQLPGCLILNRMQNLSPPNLNADCPDSIESVYQPFLNIVTAHAPSYQRPLKVIHESIITKIKLHRCFSITCSCSCSAAPLQRKSGYLQQLQLQNIAFQPF